MARERFFKITSCDEVIPTDNYETIGKWKIKDAFAPRSAVRVEDDIIYYIMQCASVKDNFMVVISKLINLQAKLIQ